MAIAVGDQARILARADKDAVISAITEATGGAGSLRDVILYAPDWSDDTDPVVRRQCPGLKR